MTDYETPQGVGSEIQLLSTLQNWILFIDTHLKTTYDIGNRLKWLKTSIEFALDDDEFREDLVSYMEGYI